MQKVKHGSKHTKMAKHPKQGGGNLHLGSPDQTVHVKHGGDSMAKNVSNHMEVGPNHDAKGGKVQFSGSKKR